MTSEADAASDLSVWTSASDSLRAVVKWIAAAFGALGAALIGAAPLTGLGDTSDSTQRLLALAFGTASLLGVGYIVWRATTLLTPTTVTLREVGKHREFRALRDQIAADPTAYLGQWGANVSDFISNRDTDYTALGNVDNLIATLPSSDPFLNTLLTERPALVERTLACGKVSRRVLAIAGFHHLSSQFSDAKPKMFVAAAIVVVGVVGFITMTSKPSEPAPPPTVTPALVALTDRGRVELTSILGLTCCPWP